MEAPERNKCRELDLSKIEWSFYLIKVVENKPVSAWTDLASLVIQSLNNVKYVEKKYNIIIFFKTFVRKKNIFDNWHTYYKL